MDEDLKQYLEGMEARIGTRMEQMETRLLTEEYGWMAKKEMTVREMASLGGKARGENLSAEELTAIARQGAEARNDALSPERRAEIAQKAAETRWGKKAKVEPVKAAKKKAAKKAKS